MIGKSARLSLIVAAILGLAGVAPGLPCRAVQAAEEKPTARPQVGRPVQAAQQLLKQKKFKEALDKLHEADAVARKTPYETYVIEATRAAIALGSDDFAAAIKALEAVLATGMLPPADTLQRLATLVQLAYRIGDYAKVASYAERYYRAGGKEREPRLLLAQAYYQQNEFSGAAKICRQLVQEDAASGRPPSESVLQMLVSSEYKQGNAAGQIDGLQRLVAAFPKPEYWRELVAAVQRKPGFAGRLSLDVYRLLAATGAMTNADQYMEAAQLAMQAGLPGDAKTLLDQGYGAGLLGKGPRADRQQRLASMAAAQAGDDKKGLAQLARETEANDNGLAWVRLGEAYASYGQYDSAIAALQKGIDKGGLKYSEDAKLHLGIAYLKAKQPAKAAAVLKAVAGEDGVHGLAQLWLLYRH